ncbi:MAG: Glu-tRNA(Gln) amidotransferase subunit GatE [candidate division Zixibacteria bacterium]|nr:Glu-tRNA(Gln) amidotransferase subunit GatE [candidate division Zixibacteria bacterium]
MKNFDAKENYIATREAIGYVSRNKSNESVYEKLGFKSGLEIHQQLHTDKKLFCRCPVGLYRDGDDYDAELIRHMRPTLSELGEYDGTALMEFRTKKNIYYRIKDESACTYDIDDTPPFPINKNALDIAIEVGLLLGASIVGELHITRKQYLDGSIPAGFQRTAIVGVGGEIPISNKKIGIIQLSIEEDSCREVSDIGHDRVYTTDRLGTPLIESVTQPHMTTPDEVAEAAHYLRFLVRSTGKMRTGIGAAREDVNVSITGGTRVEIKGVAHIRWIPELTHIEAFRQKALLIISDILKKKYKSADNWAISSTPIDTASLKITGGPLALIRAQKYNVTAVNLPGFQGILSHFTQPGKTFGNELSDRLKVIACLEKPNHVHSEQFTVEDNAPVISDEHWKVIRRELKSKDGDAQMLIWGDERDTKTALETIEERCRMAFDGVPNETRKALTNGTTLFERVLPGADRMYPDTDSAPIPIEEEQIGKIREILPVSVENRLEQLKQWSIPTDTYRFILKKNLVWLIENIISDYDLPPKFIGTFFGHTLRFVERTVTPSAEFNYYAIYGLFKFIHNAGLHHNISSLMMPELYAHPKMVFDSILDVVGYKKRSKSDILKHVPDLRKKFAEIGITKTAPAEINWIMGHLRKIAIGNVSLKELSDAVAGEVKS